MYLKSEIKRLGNIYGFDGGSYAGNGYSPKGLCPALNSTGGGNRQPMFIQARKAGLEHKTGNS